MKTSTLLAVIAALSTSLVQAVPLDDTSILERATDNLPELNNVQTTRAYQIIGEVKKEGLGQQGCKAAITTGLTEVCPAHKVITRTLPS